MSIYPPLTLAQNAGYEVKGVVVDKSGMPILGATVVEKGTTNGVSTGIDGDYAIRAAGPESVIEVSYVGYKTVSLVASSSLLAHLTLEEDAMGIDDVVVIGYGTVKKNDMTGSVVAIKAEEFNRGAVVSTQDMLKGKVPGVHIIPGDGGPGSSATIRLERPADRDRRGAHRSRRRQGYGQPAGDDQPQRHRILHRAQGRFGGGHLRFARLERRHPRHHQEGARQHAPRIVQRQRERPDQLRRAARDVARRVPHLHRPGIPRRYDHGRQGAVDARRQEHQLAGLGLPHRHFA